MVPHLTDTSPSPSGLVYIVPHSWGRGLSSLSPIHGFLPFSIVPCYGRHNQSSPSSSSLPSTLLTFTFNSTSISIKSFHIFHFIHSTSSLHPNHPNIVNPFIQNAKFNSITMSRRDQNKPDDSLPESPKDLAITTLQAAGDILGHRLFSDSDIQNSEPQMILNRMLSTKSYISITEAHVDTEKRTFKQIGSGQCGTVYALIGITEVLKVPNQGKTEALWNDAKMHVQVEEAFRRTLLERRQQINIPRFGQWVLSVDTAFWNGCKKYFPPSFQPTQGLLTSRIFALPYPVRAAIFDSFASKDMKKNRELHLTKPENKDCLVRLYLGRRLKEVTRSNVTLRNFPLHVNERYGIPGP